MATADKLSYLLETKQAIKSALESKGQTVADTDSFRSYADKVLAISSGGADVELFDDLVLDVNFTNGNMTFTAPEGLAIIGAVINKPETLVPENIVDGVEIAGVTGTYKGGDGADWWGVLTNYGTRTNFNNFLNSTAMTPSTFRPTYSIAPVNASQMFYYMNNSATTKEEQIDFIAATAEYGTTFDFSNLGSFNLTFATGGISRIGKVDLKSCAGATNYIFYGGYNTNIGISYIEELRVYENNTFVSNSFGRAQWLEHIGFTGTLATNGLNLSACTLLDHETLESLINILADKSSNTSTVWKVTVGSANLAKLTETDLSNIAAKGWVFE